MPSIVDALAESMDRDHTAALANYRRLLMKDKPTAGDVRALQELMQTLGKTPDDARADLQILTEVVDLERLAATAVDHVTRCAELSARCDEAEARVRAARDEAEAADLALTDANGALFAAQADRRKAQVAGERRRDLMRSHTSLFPAT